MPNDEEEPKLDPKYFDPDGPAPRPVPGSVRKRRRIRMSEAETRAGAEGRPASVPTKPGGST